MGQWEMGQWEMGQWEMVPFTTSKLLTGFTECVNDRVKPLNLIKYDVCEVIGVL